MNDMQLKPTTPIDEEKFLEMMTGLSAETRKLIEVHKKWNEESTEEIDKLSKLADTYSWAVKSFWAIVTAVIIGAIYIGLTDNSSYFSELLIGIPAGFAALLITVNAVSLDKRKELHDLQKNHKEEREKHRELFMARANSLGAMIRNINATSKLLREFSVNRYDDFDNYEAEVFGLTDFCNDITVSPIFSPEYTIHLVKFRALYKQTAAAVNDPREDLPTKDVPIEKLLTDLQKELASAESPLKKELHETRAILKSLYPIEQEDQPQ